MFIKFLTTSLFLLGITLASIVNQKQPGETQTVEYRLGGPVYVVDMCHRNPKFKAEFHRLITSPDAPTWYRHCNQGVQSPAKTVWLHGTPYAAFVACKPRNCSSEKVVILFDGQQSDGFVITEDGVIKWLREPNFQFQEEFSKIQQATL